MSWYAVGMMAVQLGYGMYQSSKGAKQSRDAQKLLEDMPDYKIPHAAKQAMLTAELQSMQGMPDEVKNELLQQMDRSTMSSLRQISERRGGLGAVSQLDQNQQDSLRQLAVMDAQAREKNLQSLQSMRQTMAGYEEAGQQHEFDRQYAMYQNTAGAASAMKGAGAQNIMGAATSLGMYGAQGGFGGGGSGAQRQAYEGYTGDLETTNVAAYDKYAQGVPTGTDAMSYADWKADPTMGYIAPQEFKPWRADMRAKGGEMPWGSDWWYNTRQKAKNTLSTGGQGQDPVNTSGVNVGDEAGTYTAQDISRQAALSSGAIPTQTSTFPSGLSLRGTSTGLSLSGTPTGLSNPSLVNPLSASQVGTKPSPFLYGTQPVTPQLTQAFTGTEPFGGIHSRTDNVLLQSNLDADAAPLSEGSQYGVSALLNEPNVTVSDEFISGGATEEVPIEGVVEQPIEGVVEQPIAPIKPESKDFKTSSDYMKARMQYFKDLESYEAGQKGQVDTEVSTDKTPTVVEEVVDAPVVTEEVAEVVDAPVVTQEVVDAPVVTEEVAEVVTTEDVDTEGKAEIIEIGKDYNVQFNNDGTISFMGTKRSPQESLDEKYGTGSMSPAELLPTSSRVQKAVLGDEKGKWTYSDDRKTRTKEYTHGTETREQTDYGYKQTYKITDKNHPLYGKEYVVKVTENPDYLGKTSSEYKDLNYKLSQAKPSEKAKIQEEMDRIGKKYLYEDISKGKTVE